MPNFEQIPPEEELSVEDELRIEISQADRELRKLEQDPNADKEKLKEAMVARNALIDQLTALERRQMYNDR